MPDESDWAANAAMTDEEIEVAIASDPEEAERHKGWLQRGRVVRPRPRFFMCINNKGNEDRLTLLRIYKVVPDVEATDNMIKIVEDTGEAYWFTASCFVPVQLSIEAEKCFDVVTTV